MEVEEDPNAKIFDDVQARQDLHLQMAQLSPRRASYGSLETTTLPFYEEISPSVALERLFKWFHSMSESNDSPMDDDDEDEDARKKISQAEFNQLRKCIGKAAVNDREWKRALEELGTREGENCVKRKDFKALFGPPPFFGSPTVLGIVRAVMEAEEYIYFAQMLVTRFGVNSPNAKSNSLDDEKVIGLEQFQSMQRACCADTVFEEADWVELCTKMMLPESPKYFTWMQFAESFATIVKKKRPFSPHADPTAVVYAVLANENVLATIKDADDDKVSQKAFTNLLRVQEEKVDDEAWLNLLQNMQTTYNYRQEKRGRRASLAGADSSEDSDGHGHEQPLVIVRNTHNQVLSYEIVFDEHGNVGLDLQSDFFGQCLTVAEISGQASRHPIIHKHDIVAAINGEPITYDTMAANKVEELERVAHAKRLLDANCVRKVTFHRQESYFQYDADEKTLHLCLMTIEEIAPDGKFLIQFPQGSSWKPTSFSASDGTSSLAIEFEIPKHEAFDQAMISWNHATQIIDISLDGEIGIAKNSSVVLKVSGVDCGDEIVLGPCELTEGEFQISLDEKVAACTVQLYNNWKYRESTLGNPLRDRKHQLDEYFDSSLKPLEIDFPSGDSGLTLGSDFFGQCPVVTAVKANSAANKLSVRQHDILTSITSLGGSGGNTLNQLQCIKPFALSKRSAESHINEVKKELARTQKLGGPYRLEFLRLSSYFFHENGRTAFTFHALTSLREEASLVIKMPNTKWHVTGPITANILEPTGIKFREVFWDSQQHCLNLVFDNCSIPESTVVTVEIHGVSPPSKEKKWAIISEGKANNCAGPSEVVGIYAGDSANAPEMEFVLHEHWHSFIVGHQGIDVSKVNDTLKRFKTNPSSLWKVLEYTSLLFNMCKSADSENLSFSDLNKLIGLVCGDEETMKLDKWNTLCRNLGAKPLVGLTRRQFACCWNDVTGLNNHSAKDVYVRAHTAKMLFSEIKRIFQEDEEDDVITEDTIVTLAQIAGLSESMTKKALETLNADGQRGWDCDTFSQIVCGGNRHFKFEDNASSLWIKIFYAKKLFNEFSTKNKMKKKDFVDLLAAAKVTQTKLTNELWTEICDDVGLDETSGFTLGDFLKVYAGDRLGSRHPLADYYRIETFKLLPEKRMKSQDTSKEAALNVAPEKVNVADIAEKALEETASTEEVFQDLLEQGLEFSKLEKIEEQDMTSVFKFESKLSSKKRSRSKGFLHLQIGSISELADRLIAQDKTFNKDGSQPEELYAMFEITDANGLRERMPGSPKKSRCLKMTETLIGSKDIEASRYDVRTDELWDDATTQRLMREVHEAEKKLKACPPHNHAEYEAARRELAELVKRLTPIRRVFSSLVLRDRSPDAIVRFPDDQFRLYVDFDDKSSRKQLLLCKLFKRIGSERSKLELEKGYAIEAQKKAEVTCTVLKDLVDQQKELLRHVVAGHHAKGRDTIDDNDVWMTLSKLRQKQQDLLEFQEEVKKQNLVVQNIQDKLDDLLRKEMNGENENTDRSAPVDATSPTNRSKKTHETKTEQTKIGTVRFIGQAFFDIGELLHVLHDDKEITDDMATFTTEKHRDVGILLLKFQYKCAFLQQEAPPMPLPEFTIAMSGNGKSSVVEKIREEKALEYPSHSNLELQWKSDVLEKGDRLCLAREEDPYKLSMPYFLLLWNTVNDGDQKNKGKGVVGENGDDERCEWWIPDILKKLYSDSGENPINTDASKKHGTLHFPSSIDLSLPPGTYKLYLLRNDARNNVRVTLGKTASLAVLPGLNSVHTSFGTTPLIDVKPLFATLQVFSEEDRSVVADALNNRDGFYDQLYVDKVTLEQEIEVTEREIKASEAVVNKLKEKKEGRDAKQKITTLQNVLKDLLARKEEIVKSEVLSLEKSKASTDTSKLSQSGTPGAQHAHTVFWSSQEVVLSYRFTGGAPSPQDRIVFLPADVVRVSDLLRSTILGKLQGNDSEHVAAIRETMERELVEVEQVFAWKFTLRSLYKLIKRKLKPYFGCGSGNSSKDKSDIYKAITGATDGSFVWDECMSAYKSAPPIAKSNFIVIIRDLLDEIGARKAHLGLKKSTPRKADSRLAKANALMKLGLEIPVLVPGEMTSSSGLAAARGSNNVIVGECKASLGNRFRQGGFYVAKYVRRALESQDDGNILETSGEICRFGPFYIEPAVFSYSPTQMYLFVAKSIVRTAKSDECILFLKVAGHGLVSFLKYFLAVISLSFNISVLAGNFSVDLTQIRHILDSFNQKLSSYFGPVEVVLEAIYAFFNGYIQDLMEHLNLIKVAGECVTGFFLLPIFALLFAATFVVYIVVQEDLLLKIQKIHTYLPINPGKTLLGFLEQVGALLVIPLYLTIKSCVLFISGHWSTFYHRLGSGEGLAAFQLYSTPHGICDSDELAKANYGVGIVALVLIVFFLFISLPLLLLDLFSWVPLSELEERDKLKDLAHSFDRKSIKAAVHSNATLTECPTCCPRPWKFQAFYDDYMQLPFRDLLQKYGILGLFLVFVYIYIILMGQSMLRSLGVLIGWRGRAWYMYKNVRSRPYSKWQFYDRFCLRFNFAWKVQYIKDKMVMPFVNLAMVTMGLWGETQWKEYNVEERANDCYLMEPSGEIKQLQMMSLHGKIVSLFWLCIPKTMVLAYLAEVLNRGPAFSYFLNRQFLQADIPESEREKDPVWRFGSILKFAGEEDVVYLTDTRFYSTVLKWGSSIVEIVSLLSVYPEGHQNRTFLFGIALISTAVAPFLEFNQQAIKAYVDYMETAENFASSNSCISKLREGKDAFDASKDALDDTPRVGINLRAAARRNRNEVVSSPGTTNGVQSTAPNGTKEGQNATPTSVVAVPAQSSTSIAAAAVSATGASGMIHVGGDDDWSGEAELGEMVEDNEDNMEEAAENAVGEDGVAVALATAGMAKPKKQLILLNAMPEISYVVLTDALDEGEGEITLNWQINARQRFHALDAIGMFPARAPGDVRIRTMEDCICYRLLKRRDAQKFGWKPEKHSDEDFERETILLQAKSLRDITEKNIKEIMNVPLSAIEDEQARQDKYAEKEEMLRKADDTMGTMMNSSKLKPYKKKMSDILEEEVLEKNLHNVSRRSTRMLTNATLGAEEAAKRARKVVTGQVKFRPANSNVKESDPKFETFVYGNNAGIYQSKYGLQRYEFCYLRHADVEAKIVGLNTEKEKAGGSKVSPASEQSQHYEILDRFCSNPISIGTFNIFMNLTCDIPLVGANEVVNLSWIIYGVPYRILSNSKSRNCIGFYKVEDTGACAKIEIIPTSAYLEVGGSEPCPGRMTVTAPKEPGVYEIRFLFNFFKKAQLHRQCQVFGDLEDQMQQLRIRSFFEKRSLTEEIQKFAAREPKPWGIARMNTYAWLKSMLLSTLREPVAKSVMESTSEYGAFLYGRLKSKMNEGLKCKSPIYQRRIRQMIGPLYLNGFMEVLQVALASNSQMNDQLASITFISPTEDDIKHEGLNPFRDALLLPKDDELLLYGTSSFHHQARNYLKRQSLCGYHDFIDDIVLNQSQLLQTLDQVMKNVSSSCVTLYESAIVKAVEAMMGEAEAMSLGNVLQGIDAILTDLCRNHIQSMVRAFVETDCRTGMRKLKAPIGTLERLQALRRGFVHMEDLMVDVENYGPTPRDGGFAPVTRQHIAIRRWIKPRLERKITIILRQRHARLLSNYSSFLWQMRHACCIRTPSLVGNPFPSHRPGKTQSALYFLAETGTSNKAEDKQSKGRFAVTSEDNLADEQLENKGQVEDEVAADQRDDKEKEPQAEETNADRKQEEEVQDQQQDNLEQEQEQLEEDNLGEDEDMAQFDALAE